MSARLALLESAKKVRACLAQHPGGLTFMQLVERPELALVDLPAALAVLLRERLIREQADPAQPGDSLLSRYFVREMEAPQ